jgi:hypothetical protein
MHAKEGLQPLLLQGEFEHFESLLKVSVLLLELPLLPVQQREFGLEFRPLV